MLLTSCAFGGRLPIGADFTQEGALPSGWGFQPHTIFKPDPSSCLAAADDGSRVLRVGPIQGKSGTAFGPLAKYPAKKGETVEINFTARGTGTVEVSSARFNPQGAWNRTSSGRTAKLTDAWRPFSFDIPVEDSPVGTTGSIQLWFGGKRGSSYELKDVSVHCRKSALPGSGEIVLVKTIDSDDYESVRQRPGNPQIVTGDLAPGIPKQVKRGRYRLDAPVNVTFPGRRYTLPPADDEFFVFGVRLYALEGSTAKFVFGTDREHVFQLPLPALPVGKLPADLTYAVDRNGSGMLTVRSLADTSVVRTPSYAPFFDGQDKPFVAAVSLMPTTSGGLAELDELFAAAARHAPRQAFPTRVVPEETFDPRTKGWPVVFRDEFDGQTLDAEKWFVPSWRRKDADLVRLDGKGNLEILAEPSRTDPGVLRTTGLWSKPAFRYGYFEARLKFTYLPGWWAAFWLYGITTKNPFIDGVEVDMFEDYPSRGQEARNSHNVHNNVPVEASKSWSFHSRLPEPLDGYHVFGCKRTPFEISEYLDGKLIRSIDRTGGRDTVTFSAFETVACNVPLHLIFSGSVAGSTRGKIDFAKHPYPDRFTIDWVRVYGWPDEGKGPCLSWEGDTRARIVRPGETLRFEAEVRPQAGKVRAVYLFDNGYPLACRTEPPYRFEIPFSKSYYETTDYMKPGRSGVTPPFDGYVHAFALFAEDDRGIVSSTGPLLRIPESVQGLRPWDGKRIGLLRSTDCFSLSYDAGAGGRSRLGLRYAASRDLEFDNRCKVLVDGVECAELKLPPIDSSSEVAAAEIDFTPGRHDLLFVPMGIFSVYGLERKGP